MAEQSKSYPGHENALALLKLGTALTASVATADFAACFHKPSDALQMTHVVRKIVGEIVSEVAGMVADYEQATSEEIQQ